MVVCKFFQQGNCRFGQNCRFDHIYGSKYSYHAQPAANNTSAVTDEQLIYQVQTDIQAALRGGQWILSAYAPYKEKPIFPGLVDISPDEVRLSIYEGRANNNLDQAVMQINKIVADARSKYEQLLKPTANIVKVLKRLYNGEKPESPFLSQSENIFGAAQNQGLQNEASALFRTAVETGSSMQITVPNLLTNNANQFFEGGASHQTMYDFNKIASEERSKHSIFSQSPQSNLPNDYQNPTFSLTNSPNPRDIFANASRSVFTDMSNNSPIFSNTGSHSSIFEKPSQNHNIFGPPNVPSMPFNAFGVATNSESNVKEEIYSKKEDLDPDDLEAFKSDEFRLGFIPELPPSQDLCF